MTKRRLSLILTIALFALFSTNANAAKPTKTALSQQNITLQIGAKKSIQLKKAPTLTKRKIKSVKWTSSNKKVVTVTEKGKAKKKAIVKAISSGTATIKVKYGGKVYKCVVTVPDGKTSSTWIEKDNTQTQTTESPKTTEQNGTEKSTEQEKNNNNSSNDNNSAHDDQKTNVHTHSYSMQEVQKATFSRNGYKMNVCDECGKVEESSERVYLPILKSPTEIKPISSSEMKANEYYDIIPTGDNAVEKYFKLPKKSRIIVYIRELTKYAGYVYQSVSLEYDGSDVSFVTYNGILSEEEMNPDAIRCIDLHFAELLADDVCPGISMVDGTGLTDAGDGNYTNKYHLSKNEIAQCLNSNDLYVDGDCAYLSPQGLWALRFLKKDSFGYSDMGGTTYTSFAVPDTSCIYILE